MTQPITATNEPRMHYRSLTLRRDPQDGRPATLDERSRSVEVIGATEEPVEVFDYERWEVVPEVLLMDGLEIPKNRQVPLLDSHSRTSSAAVLGSYRDMSARNGQLTGRAFFSSVPEAEGPYTKLREGHLTDFSAGYRVIQSTWIEEGRSAVIRGRSFSGPLRVTERWRIKELSITPIGADELAKVRSEPKPGEPPATALPKNNESQRGISMPENIEFEKPKTPAQAERERIAEIQGAARATGYPEIETQKLIDGDVPSPAAIRQMFEWQRTASGIVGGVGHRVPTSYGADELEKRGAAITDGLCLRAGLRIENPAPGADEYRSIPLYRIAEECLEAAGVRTRGMGLHQIVSQALNYRGQRAYVTADFPSMLANSLGKVLRIAYEQAPGTYERWCRQTSGVDFKEMSRVQISEAPGLDEVPEHGVYKYGRFGDSKEVFKIGKFGKLFAVTREAIINDDLAGLARVPLAFAMSARRLVNASAYGILTANAAMGDGTALFHANHNNLGTSAAIGITSMGAARLAMRKQTGLNGAVLNIAPKYLIVPPDIETSTEAFLAEIGQVESFGGVAQANPFRGKLDLVVDAVLSASSISSWYLAADPAVFDTVEVCFLNNRREPYLETRDGWTVDGVEYKVRIEFGVKAIDWRGLYKNPG